jgi:lipoxygenase homology domain-containing protein 1
VSAAALQDPAHCEVDYSIQIQTADVRLAGTDADVHVALVGSLGTTKRLPLQHGAGCPHEWFQRGRTDTFQERAVDVGELEEVVIGHNNTGAALMLGSNAQK